MRLKSAIVGDDWRPIILKGEANRGTLDKVDLHFDSVSGVDEVPSDEYKGGFTVLTSVRLIWATNPRSASFGVPCVLPLFSVVDTELKIEGKLTSLLKPSKIKLTIRLDEQGYPTDSRRAVSCERVKLVCRGGTPEAWYSLLQRTLAERAWVVGGSSATPSERSFHSRSSSLQGSPQRSQRSFNRAGSWSGSPERGPPRLALSPTPALSPLLLQQYGPRPSGYASPERSQRSLTGRPPHGGPSPPRRQPSSDSLASGLHPGSVGVGLPNPPSRTLSMTRQQAPPVDPTLVDQLERMGFPNRQAVSALLATGSAGLQPALDWLLDSANTAVLDQPAPYPPCPAPPDQQPSPAGPTNWGAALMAGVLGRGRNRGIVDAAPPQPLPAQQQASQWECGPMRAAMVGTSFSAVAGVDTSGWTASEAEQAQGGSNLEALNPMMAGLSVAAEAQHGPRQQVPARQLSLGGVGVAGVLRREERRAAETEHTLEQAFTDLSNLMGKASDMVQLAEKFRVHMAKRKEQGSGGQGEGGGGVDGEELDAETALDLLSLGIVNPVTKESAGRQYEQQLARQLSDFLRVPVERYGGMMPLPDVYCLFNRARGAELVSPDDLLAAVKLFPSVGAPFQLREFSSGVRVVQAAGHSDEQVCRHLADMVAFACGDVGVDRVDGTGGICPTAHGAPQEGCGGMEVPGLGPGISATDVASSMSVPLAVAAEHLVTAEGAGVLCRDDGPEGLRFFRNFFTGEGEVSVGAC